MILEFIFLGAFAVCMFIFPMFIDRLRKDYEYGTAFTLGFVTVIFFGIYTTGIYHIGKRNIHLYPGDRFEIGNIEITQEGDTIKSYRIIKDGKQDK